MYIYNYSYIYIYWYTHTHTIYLPNPMFSQIKLLPWNLHMDLRRIGVWKKSYHARPGSYGASTSTCRLEGESIISGWYFPLWESDHVWWLMTSTAIISVCNTLQSETVSKTSWSASATWRPRSSKALLILFRESHPPDIVIWYTNIYH